MKARDGIEAQRGLNDIWPGDEVEPMIDKEHVREALEGEVEAALSACPQWSTGSPLLNPDEMRAALTAAALWRQQNDIRDIPLPTPKGEQT